MADKKSLWQEKADALCYGDERIVRIKKLPTLIITADDVEQIDDILAALTRAEENREIDSPFESRAV